jgi:hypothetical protein
MSYKFPHKLLNDILKDKGSDKFSITKTIALLSFLLLGVIIMIGLYVMINKGEVDHFLVGELMFFILTLLGFKNLRRLGYDNKEGTKNNDTH